MKNVLILPLAEMYFMVQSSEGSHKQNVSRIRDHKRQNQKKEIVFLTSESRCCFSTFEDN